MLKFLYAHRFLFIVYPFDSIEGDNTGNIRAHQRWEQCLNFLEENIKPALEFFFEKSIRRDTTKLKIFAQTAVDDIARRVESLDECVLTSEVKEQVLKRLGNVTIRFTTFPENFTEGELEKFYEELNLKGDENLVQSALEIQKFGRNIGNYPSDNQEIILNYQSDFELIAYNEAGNGISK